MAANSILKLKVESEEYDAKLNKAAEGIRHLSDVAHKSAGDLTGLERSELDYIKALGDMETKSRSAAGKTRELENAFKELTVVYNELNDVEKADEGGKALAKSLETLKQRAQEARGSLNEATQSLQAQGEEGKQSSGILEQLAGKFTINIDALKLFNAGLAATKMALGVAKDAFFASEANVDEWGRIVQSSEAVYQSFLTAINNGDISGFLERIDQIVQAARQAYDELDRLRTLNTIQGPQISVQRTENERIRTMLQTGRYIAPIDGRKASMQNGQLLTPGQIRRLEQQLQGGITKMVGLIGNEVKQTGRAIDAYYNSLAKQNGMTMEEFRKGTSSMAEFDKRIHGAAQYRKWQYDNSYVDQQTGRLIAPRTGNPYAQYKGWDTFRVDKQGSNSLNYLVSLIQQRQSLQGQMYSQTGQAYRTVNRTEGITLNKIMGRSGSGRSSVGETSTKDEKKIVDPITENTRKISELASEYVTATDVRRKAIRGEISSLQGLNKEYTRLKDEALGKVVAAPVDPLTALTEKFRNGGTSSDVFSAYVSDLTSALRGADVGSELFNSLTSKLRDAREVSQLLGAALQAGVAGPDVAAAAAAFKDQLLGDDVSEESVASFLQKINEKIAEQGGLALKLNADTGELESDKPKRGKTEKLVDGINKVTNVMDTLSSGLSGIYQGLKGVGIDLGKDVEKAIGWIQSLSQVVSGVGQIISLFQGSAMAANTAALTANTYALLAKSFLPGFANGGVVPRAANGYFVGGGRWSGDMTPVMANAGELILSRSQQGVLADALDGGGLQDLRLTAEVDGESLWILLNNGNQRRGRGEIVTSRRRG